MFIPIKWLIIISLTIYVFGLLNGFAGLNYILRHYVSLKAFESLENKELLSNTLKLIEDLQNKLSVREAELLQHQDELKIKTEAIRQIVFDAHHKKLNPIFKRLLGLMNLLRISATGTTSQEYIQIMDKEIRAAEAEELARVKEIEHLQD